MLSQLQRAKLARDLSAKVKEHDDAAKMPGGGLAQLMAKTRLVTEINALSAQLAAVAPVVMTVPAPDATFKSRVIGLAYGGKVVEPVDTVGYLAAKVKKTERPVFVIDGTLGRPEYKAMIAEAQRYSLPTEKIYVFCRFATYSGDGIEAMLLSDVTGIDDAPIAPPMGFAVLAQRQFNAAERFIDSAMEQFGLTKQEAGAALDRLTKLKLVKLDPISGQFNLKDGRFWDGEVLRRAAAEQGWKAEPELQTPAPAPRVSPAAGGNDGAVVWASVMVDRRADALAFALPQYGTPATGKPNAKARALAQKEWADVPVDDQPAVMRYVRMYAPKMPIHPSPEPEKPQPEPEPETREMGGEATVGDVKFVAVRREFPRVHWTARVESTGEDMPQTYATRADMWEDLKRSAKAVGDRWAAQFEPAAAPRVSADNLKAVIANTIPDSLPADWIIMNAPRPLVGDKLADGEFLTGRFYAAIDPAGEYARSMVARNVQDDARVVFVASEATLEAMALSGIRPEYQAAYAEMDKKKRTDAMKPFVRKLNEGKTYGELVQLKEAVAQSSSALDAIETKAPDGWALFDGAVDASCPVFDYVGSEKLMELRGELAGVLAKLESAALPVLQRMALSRDAAELASRIEKRETLKPVKLQNRDRSTAASIAQVRSIGANPDPDLLGMNKTPTEGAPMVFTDYDELKLPAGQLGRKTTVTFTKDMSKIPVQYAVVEADMVMVSHDANGMPVAGFEDVEVPGVFRAVAGNGRAAGIQLAYANGTAQGYVAGLIAESDMSLVSADAIRAMKKPMLVRIMQHEAVTSDIADKTNSSGMAGFSAVEQAKTDGERVDFANLSFNDDGTPTLDSLVKFVQGMPLTEQAALAPDGTPTTQALDRMMAATFNRAYQSDELVKLYSQSLDPEIKNVLFGMAQAAGDMAALAGAGAYDIRQFVTDAAGLASNAKRSGLPLARLAEQRDMTMPEEVNDIAAMFARNARAAKRIGESLRTMARAALAEFEKDDEDMFGPVAKIAPGDLVREATGAGVLDSVAVLDAADDDLRAKLDALQSLATGSPLERMRIAREIAALTATLETTKVSIYNSDNGAGAGIGSPQDQGYGNKMATSRTTINAVNKALKAAGHNDTELVKGGGYFYFDGDEASGLYSASVATMHLQDFTPGEWVEQYESLKADNARRLGYPVDGGAVVKAENEAAEISSPISDAKQTRLKRYEAQARELLAVGFSTKADQQRAKESVSRAFSEIIGAIQDIYLSGPKDDAAGQAVYYAMPSYPHEWKPKHVDMIRADLPAAAGHIKTVSRIVLLANEIKATPLTTKIADAKVAKERAEAYEQSLNPALRSEFEAQAPGIAAEWESYMRSAYERMQAKFPEGIPAYVGHTGPNRQYQQSIDMLSDVCDTQSKRGPSGIRGHDEIHTLVLNDTTLKDKADKYGMAAALEWFYKTNGKLGELESAKLVNDSSGDVHVKGERGGKKIDMMQRRIINTSPKGKLFHQWPSRIYVDGAFVTELDYKKMFKA